MWAGVMGQVTVKHPPVVPGFPWFSLVFAALPRRTARTVPIRDTAMFMTSHPLALSLDEALLVGSLYDKITGEHRKGD